MESLYVCLFSNGHIKVGRSIEPDSRITSHAGRVACMGVSLKAASKYVCAESAHVAEASLIARCDQDATKRHKSEWFEGLEFATVCGWAEAFASKVTPPDEPFVIDLDNPDFKAILARLKRAGRTQIEIAIYCRCSQPSISDIATGITRDPSYSIGSALIRMVNSLRELSPA